MTTLSNDEEQPTPQKKEKLANYHAMPKKQKAITWSIFGVLCVLLIIYAITAVF